MKKKNKIRISLSDEVLADISKIAHSLNTNILNENDYYTNGGKYNFTNREIYEEIGSYANAASLCGLKTK